MPLLHGAVVPTGAFLFSAVSRRISYNTPSLRQYCASGHKRLTLRKPDAGDTWPDVKTHLRKQTAFLKPNNNAREPAAHLHVPNNTGRPRHSNFHSTSIQYLALAR